MRPNEPASILRPFGEPLDASVLEDFAEIEESDLDSAESWFDRHASAEWIGCLDNEEF